MRQPGATATFDHLVVDADSAIAFGSGDVPVLATPRVLALVERATCLAVEPQLGPGTTTVGVAVDLRHLRATPIGATVSVTAALTSHEGSRMVFDVRVVERGRDIAVGSVTRAVVDRQRFVDGLSGAH